MAELRYRNTPRVHGRYRTRRSEPPTWTGLIKPAFIALFAAMSFLLVHSMTHHRFFKGGPYVHPYNMSEPDR